MLLHVWLKGHVSIQYHDICSFPLPSGALRLAALKLCRPLLLLEMLPRIIQMICECMANGACVLVQP